MNDRTSARDTEPGTTPTSWLESIVTKHSDAVYTYAFDRLGAEGASLVVAETFAQAQHQADVVPEPPLQWLLTVARRLTVDELRQRDSAGLVGLSRTMRGLSDRDQKLLVLSGWYGLSSFEGARVLRCSRATYTVRLLRARRRLRQHLSPEGPFSLTRAS